MMILLIASICSHWLRIKLVATSQKNLDLRQYRKTQALDRISIKLESLEKVAKKQNNLA